MVYSAEISRANPSVFVFLIDQSGSMSDPMAGAGAGQRKCDFLADAINRLLQELCLRCAKEEGVRDYFQVAVLGYGARTGPALAGSLAGRGLIPLSEIALSPARIEERAKRVPDGAGGLVETKAKFPIWIEAMANGGTPMCAALGQAEELLRNWLGSHQSSFPPVVLNITDGESTDGDPTSAASAVMNLATADGNVLLFNMHISTDKANPVQFPDNDGMLPNAHAKTLFGVSSVLPSGMRSFAQSLGIPVSDGTRGFVFNADATSMVQFLEIGTRAGDLR